MPFILHERKITDSTDAAAVRDVVTIRVAIDIADPDRATAIQAIYEQAARDAQQVIDGRQDPPVKP